MTVSRKALCAAYGLIGLVTLVGAYGNVLGMLKQRGFVGGTMQFWQDLFVNDSTQFLAIDILFLGLAVILWMLIEARRLGIGAVWGYIFLALFVHISTAVPLFLIHREIKLGEADPASPGGTLRPLDVVGLLVLSVVFVGVIGLTWMH